MAEESPLYKDSPAGVTTGYLGYLTNEQQSALDTLKAELTELNFQWADDYELLRFLRARAFDVVRAKEMFAKYKEWYAKFNISQYPANYPPMVDTLAEIVPHAFSGFDKEGHPIYIERTGLIDCPTLMAQLTDNQILVGHIWGQENQIKRCREAAIARGLPPGAIERFTTIMDLKGLSMSHRAALKFTELITKNDEAFYPERMGYVIIVNPPFIFNFFWGIAKLWLDPVTKSKIVVCKDKDFATLHKYVDKDQLPTIYGGTVDIPGLAEPDVDAIRAKYLNDDKFKDSYQTATVSAGKKHIVQQTVKAHFGYQYCFRTTEDIKFSIRFFPEGISLDNVDQSIVVNNEGKMSYQWPNLGYYCGELNGTLVFQWENDNWWGDKVIQYTVIEEVPPASTHPNAGAQDADDESKEITEGIADLTVGGDAQ